MADRLRYPAALVDKVRDLANRLPDAEIADRFSREGYASAKGKSLHCEYCAVDSLALLDSAGRNRLA